MRTFDGADKWEKSIIPEFTGIYDLRLTSDAEGYFIANNDTGGTYFCRSLDTCKTWSEISTDDYQIDSYFVVNENLLYGAMRDSLYDQHLMKSIDGGKSWIKEISLKNWWLGQMYFHDNQTGILLYHVGGFRGESANLLILTNAVDPAQWKLRRFAYNFEDVYFHDFDSGLTFGGYYIFHGPVGGDMFTTEDGGDTWALDHSFPGYVHTCSFPGQSVGYVLVRDWMSLIYKTIDNGTTWKLAYYNNPDSTGIEIAINDIFFISDDVGYAAGRFWTQDSAGACILASSDGGKQWDFLWTFRDKGETYHDLTALYLIDNTIWAVGEGGFMVTSSETDSFRIIDSNTDLPLNEVFFSDQQRGWVAGGYWSGGETKPILLRTTNGGVTWKIDTNVPYLVNEIFFRDSRQGWVVGSDSSGQGMILATGNGGESWFIQADDLPASLNGMHFIGDYGWAVGEHGLVLKTENGGVNWIDARNEITYPASFKLNQNYPNPFNPITVISWQLAVSSQVELTVYNVLGEKLATLVSKRMDPGNHRYMFDGSMLASGIYYYQLVAGEIKEIRKMIRLR